VIGPHPYQTDQPNRYLSTPVRATNEPTNEAIMLRLLCVFALALPTTLAAQETRVVTGVVVDAESGAAVADVLLTMPGTDVRAVTDPEGRFRVFGIPSGRVQLVLRHVGYGEHGLAVAPGARDLLVRISSRAIELQPVVVEVLSSEEQARRASGNSLNVIDRPTIDAYLRRGEPFQNVLREVPGITVNRNCIEYRLASLTTRAAEGPVTTEQPDVLKPCRSMTVYIDGMWMQVGGTELLQTLALQDLERIEVLSPSEAGVRYQDAARGVLVIETRRGRTAGTPESPDREQINVTGFGWNEPEPYRWLRVLGSSAIGSATTIALAHTAIDCGEDEAFLPEGPMCSATGGVGAGILTGALSSLVTRWAGGTPYSKGRVLPSAVLGTATASIGYILWIRGENRSSDASRMAGQMIVGLGVPLSLTLSDRVFRVLR
jgi:hypothetical protein